MIFGGRASFLPMGIDRIHAILHKGMLEVHPAARRLPGRLRLGRQRRLHLRPDAPCRARDGVTYAMGCCGTGVALMTSLGTAVGGWLGGGPAPALARLPFPLVPAPYEGRPWFLPFAGELFRLQDWLARRGVLG